MMDAFDHLPLSAIIDDKYIGMHGGISPDLAKPEQINKIDRFQEVPLDGIFCDLLWADPIADELAEKKDWVDNEERECSYLFGKKPAQKLLDSNNLMTIFRAHQVQLEGYKMHRWDGANSFPYVVTIFSAPNYCGYYSNKASVILLDGGNVSIKQYEEATEVPYHLPERMDVFTWSVPFLAEKVTQMLLTVVSRVAEGDEDGEDFGNMDPAQRQEIMKAKVMAVGRVHKMFSTLREESELLLKLKNMSPDGKLPKGILLKGRPAIKNALKEFEVAKKLDQVNEKRPTKKK